MNDTIKGRDMVRGISVCNPVDVDPEYFLYTVEYAIRNGMTHIQLIGPIHDYVKGNIDGMTPYRKYSQFNNTKDEAYMNLCLEHVNIGCKRAHEAGVKMYFWHHELDLPTGFEEAYPEILNSDNDIEVTHPIVRDFLENRIDDFFAAYPYMDGIILTLHETKVPLLRLQNQKLGKVERVKYVTEILYTACKRLGKELIVRPFASVAEDYDMMTKAYESISTDLVIMDKWTQFDWSLCLPHNQFYHKIKNNPLFVETDIFGEFFGKGRLPLMLRQHIIDKFAYCEGFKPVGYVSRIDRGGLDPFGSVNEVNIDIINACMRGEDVDAVVDAFFEKNYPGIGREVREVMEPTEQILREIIWLKGYYYSQLSAFPCVNHSKNHFYFEMMRKDYAIASNEWFIPIGWQRGSIEGVLEEKMHAVETATKAYEKLVSLKDKMDAAAYESLHLKFINLKYVANIWNAMTHVFLNYVRYFETRDAAYEEKLEAALAELLAWAKEGAEVIGDEFYCLNAVTFGESRKVDFIGAFVDEIRQNFRTERMLTEKIEKEENLVDFVICGSAMEGHKLQKEVNFSDTYVSDESIYRIPGTGRGTDWSAINTHGWFSYEIRVKPNAENKIKLTLGAHLCDKVDIRVTIGDEKHTVQKEANGGTVEAVIPYTAKEDTVRIRVDRFTGNTPCVHNIRVYAE